MVAGFLVQPLLADFSYFPILPLVLSFISQINLLHLNLCLKVDLGGYVKGETK